MTENLSLTDLASPFRRGLVQMLTSDGKGKTSPVLGIAFFLKGGYSFGEHKILAQLPNVDLASFGSGGFIKRRGANPSDVRLVRS